MSILPVLGHKPITSYFSRTSSTKRKRKEVHKPGSETTGSSKRPKQSANASLSSSSKLVDTRPTKEDIGDGLKVTKRANRSRGSEDFPCTPLGSRSGKQSLDGTLPTPPLTCIAPFRLRKGSEMEPTSSLRRSASPGCQEDELVVTTLPTASSEDYRLFNATGFQLSGTSFVEVSNVTSITPTMSELTIPSSQSQDFPSMEVDMLTSFSKFSGKIPAPKLSEGDDLIIESSQSQLLIMASPNMRKLELQPTLPAFDVVIPSSQSQEKELTIPTAKDMETAARGRYLG
jgi:hypothetical protein